MFDAAGLARGTSGSAEIPAPGPIVGSAKSPAARVPARCKESSVAHMSLWWKGFFDLMLEQAASFIERHRLKELFRDALVGRMEEMVQFDRREDSVDIIDLI
eukprot:3486122-Amphidinium_carterae.1